MTENAFLPAFVLAWAPVWETHSWNRSLRRVVSLGLQEPAPLPQRWALVDWATGRIPVEARYAVARPRFPVAGRLLGRSGNLASWRTGGGSVRLAAATEGVFADGTMDCLAAYSRWTAPSRGVVEVRLSRRGTVSVGELAPMVGGGARIVGDGRTV